MSLEDLRDLFPIRRRKLRHYYGDITRNLFLAAGGTMLIFIPLQGSIFPEAAFLFIFGVILVCVLAGLTDARKRWVAVMNAALAFLGLAFFEFYGLQSYRVDGFSFEFLVHQAIALIFFFALYYSTKTLRAMMTGKLPPVSPTGPSEGVL